MTWTETVRIVQGPQNKARTFSGLYASHYCARDYCSLVDAALYQILAVMITTT